MDTVEIESTLDDFRVKCANHLAKTVKLQTIWDDAIRHGVKPDYDSHTTNGTWVNVAEYDENASESTLDVEATQKRLAAVVQWAKKRGYAIEKKYDDSEFTVFVTIDDELRLRFYSTRQVVCKKVVKGVKVIPERTEEDVEWVCDKVAFLKVEV